MTWVKGAPNPGINRKGRQAGTRGAPLAELLVFRASKSGDAYVFLTEVMDNENLGMDFRTIAAREVLKYQRSADPPLSEAVPLIDCRCAGDAEHNISTIMHFEATGRIGHESASALCARQKDWIEAHVITTVQFEAREAVRQMAELRPLLQGLGQTVAGGLPALPLGQNPDGKDWPPIKTPDATKPWDGDKDSK
jgi:hypothetical protein